METYYKIVKSCNKKLCSLTSNEISKNSRKKEKDGVRYIRNKWTYPKKNANQFLFICKYNELNDFQHFKKCNAVIYKCEVINPRYDSGWGLIADAVKITKRIRKL